MDVVEELRKVANDIMDNACLPERFVTNGVDGALRRDIAAALLAERERCAQIADAFADREDALAIVKPAADAPSYRHGEKVANELAHAIRS